MEGTMQDGGLGISDTEIRRIKRLAALERMKNRMENGNCAGSGNIYRDMVMDHLDRMGWRAGERKTRISRRIMGVRENRIALTKFMVREVMKKDPRDIGRKDFQISGLVTILNWYNGSPFLALKDAGLVYSKAEMARVPRNYLKLMRRTKHEE